MQNTYMLIARIFLRPFGARKNTTQLTKYPRVSYVKPSNKGFIIPLEKTKSKFGFSSPSTRKPEKPGFAVQYIILLCNTVAYFVRSLDLIW